MKDTDLAAFESAGHLYSDITSVTLSTDYDTKTRFNYTAYNQDFAGAVCFARGTKIATPCGEVLVEHLSPGDLVLTADHGARPISWVASSRLNRTQLKSNPKLLPIRFSTGSLGNGVPHQALVVSPQHRVLMRSRIAERMFGTSEVLIPAIKLLELAGVERQWDVESVEYFHLMFDQHEVVFSNGAPTESSFPGTWAVTSLADEAREELLSIFPDVAEFSNSFSLVRKVVRKSSRVDKFLARSKQNAKDVVEVSDAELRTSF